MLALLRPTFAAALALAPAAALAQYVAPAPPVAVIQEPAVTVVPQGPLTEGDAAEIAMMHGLVAVEDVDPRIWDGNFEVEGTDSTGNEIVMVIDRDTGEVLDIDD